jgi:hypothetical protein
MKLTELKTKTNTAYLYEGLTPTHKKSVMLWESVGRAIVEAELTPQQITQLFQNVEQELTASGQNRTAIGKVKDAGTAVAQAYKDLKTKVETSKPMQNADALYDQAAEKLKQATGGDQGVMKYVEKYRSFAKKHPIAQTLIYSALIAAAGISGAGAGGAAALGLLKMTDKLLQGEKFSKAAVAGAETGAMAYAAGKIGQAMKGDTATTSSSMQQSTNGMQSTWPTQGVVPPNVLKNFPPDQFQYLKNGDYWEVLDAAGNKMANFTVDSMSESVTLTNKQVTALFEGIVIEAALWDKFKAGAEEVGKKLTTKVTAASLQAAWQAAGSPTDSVEIGKILNKAGVDPAVAKSSIQSIGIDPTIDTPQTAPAGNLPDISKLTPDQKKRLLAVLDQLDTSTTPPATATIGALGKRGAVKPPQPSITDLVRQRQSMGMTESAMKKQLKKLLTK